MTDFYLIVKTLHVIGATVLLGTGAGIAFFMVMAHRTRDAALIAHTAATVVIADTIFTATAVIAQPITGAALAHILGLPLLGGWIGLSLCLYGMIGAFWLPVVWLQWRLRNLARDALRLGRPLPPLYFRLYRVWFLCGFPAFAGVLAIVWLMVAKPDF
jgi:uncharacterized membrane protein